MIVEGCMFRGVFSLCFNWNMVNFDMWEEDDFGDLFITQESKGDVVSLEENGEFKTVLDPQYSDISNDEEGGVERRMRYVAFLFLKLLILE